ncbi:retinoid-inducible serine carboxypeptidase-like isoform X1 [Chrysoperla carnea]|uniref:retinoid-inducible serine carboxypeptidase-like isoform X1 n=1 Tax=Chrysoperla carnea TaxID=189513 RepID=UPI001D0742E3|nr:retinoid-inducible serine carboxypeptidase-like isoform X1 [Chrysoperla carnea]
MKLVILSLFIIISICWCKKGFGPGEQDWDYVEVRKGAHMFWWLYYTTSNAETPESKPLIIWLQGGPGASSTGIGNFEELGPLDTNLNPRNHTWVKDYNVVFIDNPVGTGFSYVESDSLLTTNNTQIANDLIECLRSIYKKLPKFEGTPLYIAGESYGGKMAIEFAQILDEEIKQGNIKSNLKGVTLIDSWISPIDSVLTWAPYLLQTGMIDIEGYNRIEKQARKCKDLLDAGLYSEASNQWELTEDEIDAVTNSIDFYNILIKMEVEEQERNKSKLLDTLESDKLNSLMNNDVKKALNLTSNVTWSEDSDAVFDALNEDFMKPVVQIVEEVLNTTSIRVQVVSGVLDLIVDTPGTYQWVKDMHFKDKEIFFNATRYPVTVNNYIEAYYMRYNTFSLYWVLRSGHMVPADNPNAMAKILENLTFFID